MAFISIKTFGNIRVEDDNVAGRAHETIQLRLGRPVWVPIIHAVPFPNGPL